MKKVIAGGFLSLCGTIGLVGVSLFASQDLVTEWRGSRFLSTIFQNGGFAFLFVIALVMLAGGLLLMQRGCTEKEQ